MAYNKTNWENLPSTSTPINATNLNKIENGISDCVSKSGDTLTGILTFNNTNYYEAIKKVRTVNNADYTAIFGTGIAPSAKLELRDSNNNSLGSVEVKSDGVYNGNTNRKLSETAKQTWGTSMTFNMTSGQHALVMLSNSDCLMLWCAGEPNNLQLKIVRLYGTEAQATLSGNTVTISYANNRNFTGNVIIS